MGRNNAHKTCFSKIRFETKEDAEKEADRLYFEKGIMLYTYKCPLCGGFHFTRRYQKH